MRPIWTGAIGFGLVNIPVKLYSATESSDIDLDMLDKKDHSHIKYLRVNEKTGKKSKIFPRFLQFHCQCCGLEK